MHNGAHFGREVVVDAQSGSGAVTPGGGEWRPIPGFPHYEVRADGAVRSRERECLRGNWSGGIGVRVVKGRILANKGFHIPLFENDKRILVRRDKLARLAFGDEAAEKVTAGWSDREEVKPVDTQYEITKAFVQQLAVNDVSPAIEQVINDVRPALELVGARRPTPAQRIKIREAIEAHFDDEAAMYLGGQSDQTIADTLNVPRAFVETIREAAYGPIRVTAEQLAWKAELKACTDALLSLTGEVDKLRARVEKLQQESAR